MYLGKYRLHIYHYSHWVLSEMKGYSNQTLRWSNYRSEVIRSSKTSLGTRQINKQRPLSSQFSCCDAPNDVEYTRSCRLPYRDLQREPFQRNLLGLRCRERAQVLSMRTLPGKCDRCDSACSVDFHRKFKQTTISQNLLIKSWRQLPKILFMSPFRQWKPQNKFELSSFVTQSSFSWNFFLKNSKTVCYNLVKLFKKNEA